MKKIFVVLCLIACTLFGCSDKKEMDTYNLLKTNGLKLDENIDVDSLFGFTSSDGYEGFCVKIKNSDVTFLVYAIKINNKSEYYLIKGQKKDMYEFMSPTDNQSKGEAKKEYENYESQVKKAYEKFMKDNNLTDEDIEDLMLYIYEHDGDLGED